MAKGTSNNLMKITAKRRRSRVQIAEDKAEEKRQKLDLENRIVKMDTMEKEMAMMKS